MDEMIEHCAQFVGAVNENLEKPITKEEYIGQITTALNNRDIATARRCLKGMKKYGDDDTRQWAREQLKQLK